MVGQGGGLIFCHHPKNDAGRPRRRKVIECFGMQKRDPENALPLPLLRPSDRDYCPCGARKRWSRCHGAPGRETCAPANREIDAPLFGLAKTLLGFLKDVIESAEINADEVEDQFRQRCLLYFAKKMYRATLAGITLIDQRQSSMAFTLKRDQHYAWVAFHHYLDNVRQSVLFVAAGPLRQRDDAREIMEFDPDVAGDPSRQKQLRELEETANALYKRFPDLQVPRGKSGQTRNPILRDWKEPDEYAMMEALVRTWVDEAAKQGNPIPAAEVDEWCRRRVRQMRFFHAAFPSQEMHGTPMGFIGDLSDDEADLTPALNVDSHEPNGLIYMYLWYPLSVAGKLADFFDAGGFKDRWIKIRKAAEQFRGVFGGDE